MILVISNSLDEHAAFLEAKFSANGLEFKRLNTDAYPSEVSLEYVADDKKSTFDIVYRDQSNLETRVNIASVEAVWFRRPLPAAMQNLDIEDDRRFARDEANHFLRAYWEHLNSAFWLSHPRVISRAEMKPLQLSIASSLGLNIPQTLISNSPDAIQAFVKACGGKAIYKTLHGHSFVSPDGRVLAVYTSIFTSETLEEKHDALRVVPCLFQEYVAKDVELRVTIVGKKIFAAAIDSQKSETSKHDWRRYDIENTPYTAVDLPRELGDRLILLMQHLGLEFGCIDLIRKPDGSYVFLEINPNGQWLWVEKLTNLPIANALVELLQSHSR